MADPVTIAIVATGVMSAYGAIQQGKAAEAEADARQDELDMQRKQSELKATQEETERRKQLRAAEGTNIATAGTLGYNPFDSASYLALERENIREFEADVSSLQLMASLNQDSMRREGRSIKVAGKFRKRQAYWNAGTTLFKTGTGLQQTA